MGEYARRKSDNESIKIGTCESMYYLRYEDRDKVISILQAKIEEKEQNGGVEIEEYYDSEEQQIYYNEQENSVERENLGLCHKNF